jgi:hypothetical protein
MSSSVAASTTTPAPTAPAPTAPVAIGTTAPTTPAPTTPAPTTPAPTTPAPTTPAPTTPAPTTPAPTTPATPVTTASIIDAPVALIKQIIDLITLNDGKSQNGLFEISNLINTNLVQLLSTPSTQLFTSPVAFNGLQTLLNPNLNGLQTLLNPNLNGLQTLLNPSQLPTIYTSLNSLVLMLEQPELKDKIKKLNVDISVLLKFFEENEEIRNFMDNLNKLREIVKVFKL